MATAKRQNVLVTGANRGIGLAIVEHLLSQDCNVVGCSRKEATLEHPLYEHVCADVSSPADVAELMKQVESLNKKMEAMQKSFEARLKGRR